MKVIHFPMQDLNEVDRLDDAALVAGYLAGLHGDPMPADKAGQHGWRNGMADSGRSKINRAQREIASQFIQAGRSPFKAN